MGFMDELKRLARPEEYEDEETAAEPNNTTSMEEERSRRAAEQTPEEPEYVPFSAPAQEHSNKVVTMNTTTQLKVVLVKPTQFEDASAIADHLRDKRTVVLNLEDTGKDTSRRLLDFLSGVAYAQEGKIKKVSKATFIITPYNVDIVGDLLDELEKNSGMYF